MQLQHEFCIDLCPVQFSFSSGQNVLIFSTKQLGNSSMFELPVIKFALVVKHQCDKNLHDRLLISMFSPSLTKYHLLLMPNIPNFSISCMLIVQNYKPCELYDSPLQDYSRFQVIILHFVSNLIFFSCGIMSFLVEIFSFQIFGMLLI